MILVKKSRLIFETVSQTNIVVMTLLESIEQKETAQSQTVSYSLFLLVAGGLHEIELENRRRIRACSLSAEAATKSAARFSEFVEMYNYTR